MLQCIIFLTGEPFRYAFMSRRFRFARGWPVG